MRITEQQDWDRAPEIVSDAGMVIVSVPIHITEQVIAKLPRLPSDCITVDLASVKNGPLQAMLAAHDGPVVGLHPMFGPTVAAPQSRSSFGVMDVSRKPISGFWNRFRYGVHDYIGSAPLNTIRTWRLFRHCVTLRPLLTVCI